MAAPEEVLAPEEVAAPSSVAATVASTAASTAAPKRVAAPSSVAATLLAVVLGTGVAGTLPARAREEAAEKEASPPAPEAPVYEVWTEWQRIYRHPHSWAPSLTVRKGARLLVLGKEGLFSRVRILGDPRAIEGWSLLVPRRIYRAGEALEELGGEASRATIALAVKSLQEFSDEFQALRPDIEKQFEAQDASGLDPAELAEFAREAGLRAAE